MKGFSIVAGPDLEAEIHDDGRRKPLHTNRDTSITRRRVMHRLAELTELGDDRWPHHETRDPFDLIAAAEEQTYPDRVVAACRETRKIIEKVRR